MKKHQRGMSLIEVLVALAIIAIIVTFTSTMIHTALRGTRDNINKQFATQKAISMLEELRALVQGGSGATAVVLDDYDDGTTNQVILTTQRSVTDAGAPESGNRLVAGKWLFERRVTVQRIRGSSDVRLVNVKVYVNDEGGTRLMAEVASVLSTIADVMPPTQVYDVYLIAIENVPGWWLHMQNIVPFVEGAMINLQARHPGLEFRKHWIRKLSYGRDSYYTPYVNEAADSTAAIDWVYFYPGTMPTGSAVESYYPPNFFNGKVKIDGVLTNGLDAVSNPLPYTLADQYNNGMRYPDEKALFDARVAAGTEATDTPTLRLLLDDMYMNPNAYRNAIVINLHGELFPFPPVRNYSDAAKQPDVYPWTRAVTHPQQLTYPNGVDVSLRVYSYHTNVANPAAVPEWMGQDTGRPTPITIILRGISWTPAPGDIVSVTGGVNFDGAGGVDPYERESASATVAPASAPTNMWWSSTPSGPDTIIRLYNSPLKSPYDDSATCDECGLAAGARLYSLEYIPAPLEDLTPGNAVPFTEDLTADGTRPKNTARWIINIPSSRIPSDRRFTIETRIGDDVVSEFPNVSRTYFWRGSNVWLYGDATNNPNLPITERYQFMGDPRHCPYADLKMAHPASGRVGQHPLGMGYNRYFDDFDSNAGNAIGNWPGWAYQNAAFTAWYGIKNGGDTTNHNDGWDTRSGMIDVDVSRIFQVYRAALTRTNAVYTTMTGFSYYYLGMGNEIGYDASNGFTNSIPVSRKPFTGAAAGSRNEQSITDAQSGGVKYIRENVAGDYWWSMAWLGEIVPDNQWANWIRDGNLSTGIGAGRFVRVLRTDITNRLPAGTQFQYLYAGDTYPDDVIPSVRRTSEEGSTAFFWADRTNRTFHHRYQDGTTGNLQSPDGTDVAANYKLPMPPSISNNRPFDIDVNDTGMNPDHFLQDAYGTPTSLRSLAEFYRHSTGIYGSSLLALRDGSNASFVVVNGLSPTGTSGVSFISQWSFLSLIQGFLASGLYSSGGTPDPARVRELPQIAITSPNNNMDLDDPTSIDVEWSSSWFRWDGLRYTPSYPVTFTEDTTVRFALLYSRDNGKTWLFMKDSTSATPGVRPAAGYLQTATTFTFNTPAGAFPQGNYLLRVEAYRDEVPLHYSYHQFRAFIKRS